VVDPQRGVGRGQGGFVIAQVEEGDERAVLQAEEKVGVRAVFTRAGHHIALDDVVQRQAQDVFVEVPGFLGILGPVGVVVQLVDRRGCRQAALARVLWRPWSLLVYYCVTNLPYNVILCLRNAKPLLRIVINNIDPIGNLHAGH
jgi:hypothetical protein